MKQSRRVVITGMGAITPLGLSPKELYANQLEGKSGAGPIFRFDARTFPTKFGSQVKDFDLSKHVRDPQRFGKSRVSRGIKLHETDRPGVDEVANGEAVPFSLPMRERNG